VTEAVDLNSTEVKDAIAAAVEAAVDGLKTKNTELLGKLKKAQQGAAIDPADMAALESERDALKAQLAETNKAAKKTATELEAANKRASDTEAAFNNTLRDAQLTEALTKAGVTNPVHLKATKALLGSGVQMVDENGVKVAKAGDKPLADFITEWAASDEGKHFVAAPASQGDGARGGYRGTTNAKSVTRAQLDGMNPVAQAQHFKDGGTVVDA